jgi:nitric oxide reductase subunit C
MVISSLFSMTSSLKYLTVLLSLITVFTIYNTFIYTSDNTVTLSEKALKGENLWLQNNCNSCHQIYGLGGYLGPDLTNEYSRVSNENYLKAMFNSSVKTMPQFHFNESEKEEMIQFLKEIDQTGYSPNRAAKIESNGWVTLKYKNSHHER